jgi:signal transduction histidine kinase
MTGFRDLSIRSKTMLIIMLASGVALTLACAGFLSYEIINHRRALVDNLSTLSGIISISSTAAVAFGDTVAVRETLAPLSAEQHVAAACAYTAEGDLLAYYVTPGLAAVFDPPPPGPDGHRFADGYLHMYRPIEMEKKRVGTLYLRADTRALRERLVRYGGIVGMILITSVLVAFVLSSWLQRLVSRPIMSLAQVAHRVSLRQDYSLRAAKQGNDEIGRLIEYFNEMLAQIQRRDAELEVHRAHLEDEVVARTRMNEELREAKERAEAADEAKGAFLASMSHEIRTPMNGIIGMTEVTLATELTNDQRTYLNMVLASAGSLLTIITEILDLSKLETGRLELESVPFSLRGILADVVHSQGREAYDKRLELLCWIPPEVPDLVVGDPGRMRQVLVNLVGNAVKFTESGHVALEVSADDSRMDPVDLTFRVRDTGVGIPADKQEEIFESFTQVDASLTRRYGGTGLGLAICRRLVKMMGGEISVESELGRGSEFRCMIPFRVPEQQPVSFCHTLRPLLAGKTALVVTGNHALRDTVVAMLGAVGVQPSAAEDETEAWDVVRGARSRGTPFALIVSDQRSLDPRESFLLEQLRLKAGGTESAVVLLPPCATTSSVSKYRRYRKATCLIRPFMPGDLACAVADSLGVPVPEGAGTAPFGAAERQAA